MPRDLRARRAVALALLVGASCAPRRHAPAPPASAAAQRAQATLATAERLKSVHDRATYLALRRQIAADSALWRAVAAPAMEVLLGSPSSDEALGALPRLDLALATSDDATAAAQTAQAAAALRLTGTQLALSPPTAPQLAQALSDAAFALGGRALEALPGTPAAPDAVRADIAGTLDGIAAMVDELGAQTTPSPAAPARRAAVTARLTTLRARDPLVDRGRFVIETGWLGAELRALARAHGVAARPPFRPAVATRAAVADEPISMLTLPAPRAPIDAATAALGQALFFDRRLSRGGVRSCASCHRPDHAYSDGLPQPLPLRGADPIARNTPTLLYAPLQAAQLWDGRVLTTASQALAVLHAPAEMGLSDAEIAGVVRTDPALRARFDALFHDGVSSANVGRALAAFEAQALVPASAPIDRFARGDELALGAEERAGLDVFCGRGRCARCHIPPLFGGTRPSDFSVAVYAVLGVPRVAGGRVLDEDPGRARFSRRPQDRGAFKTPTLRNIGATAPYFHHGGFASLDEVIDFYDRGGGKGLGLPVDNQDPDLVPLRLDAAEKRALAAFLRHALADPL